MILLLIILSIVAAAIFIGLNLVQLYYAWKNQLRTRSLLKDFERRTQILREALKK